MGTPEALTATQSDAATILHAHNIPLKCIMEVDHDGYDVL